MTSSTPEHFDILVIGAGISGIGAGHYIRTELPSKSFAILEGRATFGGTWDLFKYPGIRSDSDLHTFGYEFKPWESKDSIADAHKIIDYLQETIVENDLGDKIRYDHKVISANWSSEDALAVADPDMATPRARLRGRLRAARPGRTAAPERERRLAHVDELLRGRQATQQRAVARRELGPAPVVDHADGIEATGDAFIEQGVHG